jgi:pimeloyl-[acyl-carrier protein] methyl ester esterase
MDVNVNGGHLYVQVTGHGSAILLIHGWPLDHRMFTPQIEPLSRAFTVIAYDRRGFGTSSALPDLTLELDDIDRILDELGIGTAHLLGVSQGGRIALRYAATRPHRIRSLVLQGAVVDGVEFQDGAKDRIPIGEYSDLVKAGKLDEVRKRWLTHPMMQLSPGHENETRLLHTIVEQYSGQDLARFEPHSYSFPMDLLAVLAVSAPPTLLLTGAGETETRRRYAVELLRRIPNSREVIFKDSGHLSNLTEQSCFNRTVVEFCRVIDSQQQ